MLVSNTAEGLSGIALEIQVIYTPILQQESLNISSITQNYFVFLLRI